MGCRNPKKTDYEHTVHRKNQPPTVGNVVCSAISPSGGSLHRSTVHELQEERMEDSGKETYKKWGLESNRIPKWSVPIPRFTFGPIPQHLIPFLKTKFPFIFLWDSAPPHQFWVATQHSQTLRASANGFLMLGTCTGGLEFLSSLLTVCVMNQIILAPTLHPGHVARISGCEKCCDVSSAT